MRKIFIYNSESFSPVTDFLKATDPKIKKKLEFMLRYMKDDKNILCEPYVKHFSIEKYKMLYELRLRAAKAMVRIIYYETDNNIILLHAFYKHDKKDTEKALEYALEIINCLNKEALYPFEGLKEVVFR